MRRHPFLTALLLCALTAACGGGEPDPQAGAATDDDVAASEAAAPDAAAVGRCAVDARDGAPYGRIAAEETNETGDRMYRIEGDGGTVWNKKAENVRVVDCPAG